MFIAREPERHLGRTVDDGHCVRYVQTVSDVGHTSTWKRGRAVAMSRLAQ